MYVTPTSFGRIYFSVGPLWIGLISTLLSLIGSRHSLTVPFALGINMKLLHNLDVSSTPSETICCLFNLYSSSFRGSCKAFATLLGVICYVNCQIPHLLLYLLLYLHYYIYLPSYIPALSVLFHGFFFCNLGYETFLVKLLLSFGSPITSHVILSMVSSSMFSIPSSAWPSPGTTKNLQLALLSLCLNLLLTCLIVQYLIGCMFPLY